MKFSKEKASRAGGLHSFIFLVFQCIETVFQLVKTAFQIVTAVFPFIGAGAFQLIHLGAQISDLRFQLLQRKLHTLLDESSEIIDIVIEGFTNSAGFVK